ncbi:allantoinase [Acrasis kona]|uniref:allantoinase n=1 Tax=Acrasis kona TaxID=1008807 RepID=A0AAW2Z0G0_9EUKA
MIKISILISLASLLAVYFIATPPVEPPTTSQPNEGCLIIQAKRMIRDSKDLIPISGTIHVGADGKIEKIADYYDLHGCQRIINTGDDIVMPGMVDTHVHVNDPGRTHWEGFLTVTKGAAAGGVTTVIDMPLNSLPPTTTVENLDIKMKTSVNQTFVDVGFLGGVVPENKNDLLPLLNAGVLGFKSFMINSGVQEFGAVDESHIETALNILKDHDIVYMFHAEVEVLELEQEIQDLIKNGNGSHYATFMKSRPPRMEVEAIRKVVELCKDKLTRCHIVHVATDEALSEMDGVSSETCTHYLFFTSESIPDGATQYKCCPPIRTAANREGLWNGLRSGVLSMVTSDHSPSPPDLKNNDFFKSWGGISSLELSLSALWTQASIRGFTFSDLVKWKCEEPAKLVQIHDRKGTIRKGLDADFVIWSPDESYVLDARKKRMFHHKHPLTPYDGRALKGVVNMTILRGVVVFTREGDVIENPTGKVLKGRYSIN